MPDIAPSTLCETFQASAARYPSAVALRAFGSGLTVTWREYAGQVETVAAGLHAIGVKQGDAVALMMSNRPEFHIVDTAAFHLGAVPFSLYGTSSPAQVAYVLENSGARAAVVDAAHADRVLASGVDLDWVVCVDGSPPKTVALNALPSPDGFSFEAAWRAVTPGDLLTIVYTPGTSGPPKGVEVTHANLIAQATAIASVFDFHLGDIGVSHLPAADIAGRLASHYLPMLYAADVTCVADLEQLSAALAEVRPTYWTTVPRILEQLRTGIEEAVESSPLPRRWLWRAARTYPHGLADPLVFRKVRTRLGLDRARFVLSGAAPLSVAVLEFFRDLGVPLCETWGMAEVCGIGTANPPGRVRPATVGVPLPGVEVRLTADDELLVRGPIVAQGYRGDPGRTADAFDTDGWLHTGDVARYDGEGYLRFLGPKEELIVNTAGKRMAPSRIESTLMAACPLISSIVVAGDRRPYNVALIVLDPRSVETLRESEVIDLEQVIADAIAAGNDELSQIEQVQRYAVLDGPWEPGGEELTPAMKPRRSAIYTKYAATIESLYA